MVPSTLLSLFYVCLHQPHVVYTIIIKPLQVVYTIIIKPFEIQDWRLVEAKLMTRSHVAGKDGDRIHAQMGPSQSPCFKPRRQVRKRGRRRRDPSAQAFCLLSYFWNIEATLLQAVFFNGVWGHTGL